jgi:hypothetical protein
VNIPLHQNILAKHPAARTGWLATRIEAGGGTDAGLEHVSRANTLHAIDQSRAEERIVQSRPSFNEQGVHLSRAEEIQDRADRSMFEDDHFRASQAQAVHGVWPLVGGRLTNGHYDRPVREGREHARFGRNAEPPVEDDASQRPPTPDMAGREKRIVGQHGVGADRDRVDFGALPVQQAVRRRARQPHAFSTAPDKSIRGDRDLGDDERPPSRHPCNERRDQATRLTFMHADTELNAMVAKIREAGAAHSRVWVAHRGNNSRDAGGHDPLDAWSRSTGVGAWLERAVERRALRARSGRVERDDFRVRTTGAQVGSLTDDDTVLRHDDGTDRRIGRCRPSAALGKEQCAIHEVRVG